MSRQGFLIQASFRPVSRVSGKPVLQLYGRLAEGQTFLLTDDREVPYFYVRTIDGGRIAGSSAAALVVPTTRRTLAGEPVSRVQVATPAAMQELGSRLLEAGIPTYEADLNLVARYLIDRGVRGSLEIHGSARPAPHEGVDLVFENPEVSPGSGVPRLACLALRVAVDTDGKLAAIALYGPAGGELLRRGEPVDQTTFADERALLTGLMQRVRAHDPDVLIGWEVVPVDLLSLRGAAQRARVTLALGRGPGAMRLQLGSARGRGGPPRAVIAGRMVIDAAAVVNLVAPQVSDEALEVVAARVLGDRMPPELTRPVAGWSAVPQLSAAQLLAEAQAIYELTAALQLIELTAQRSRLCGLPLDRTLASVAAFDYLYLLELGRRGIVAPTFQRPREPGEAVVGGHIIAPLPGVHRGIVVLDFRSLYPSLIRTFQIDPVGLLPAADADTAAAGDRALQSPIVAPSGARFRRQLGVLTVILDQIFPLRAAAKAEGDAAASQAIKLLMNSLYGVLGSPGCRFHRPELANAVTSFGRELLKWTRARAESYGYKVVYGDTDSLFIASGHAGESAAEVLALRALGEELAARLTADLADYIRATWGVESRLVLALQTVYLRLLLTRLRHGSRAKNSADPDPPSSANVDGVATVLGAAKRYAGLCAEGKNGDRRRVVFVGMEAVRRDATDLCKEAQRTLHELLFTDRPAAELENYLHRLVSDLRRGQYDDKLVYRKLLRQEPASYKQLPPHVKVAAQLGLPVGRLVRYVITRAGPQPAFAALSPLDYDHYIDKQLRPAAQPVLTIYGLDFDRVVGKDRQLKLF